MSSTDFFQFCSTELGQLNGAHIHANQTEKLIEKLRDELALTYLEVDKQCSELESMFDGFWETAAEVLKMLAIAPILGNAIEIMQCAWPLGNWEHLNHTLKHLEERHKQELAEIDKANKALEGCVHRWMDHAGGGA